MLPGLQRICMWISFFRSYPKLYGQVYEVVSHQVLQVEFAHQDKEFRRKDTQGNLCSLFFGQVIFLLILGRLIRMVYCKEIHRPS